MLPDQVIWNWVVKMCVVHMKSPSVNEKEFQAEHASVWRDMKKFLFNYLTELLFGINIHNYSVAIKLCIRVSHLTLEYLKLDRTFKAVVPFSPLFGVNIFQVNVVAVLVSHSMR